MDALVKSAERESGGWEFLVVREAHILNTLQFNLFLLLSFF